MPCIEMTMDIAAPADRVFDVFTELETAADRISGIERIEILTPGPVGEGTRWKETRKFGKREATEEMEIVRFEPKRSYTVGSESCGAHFEWTFRFEPAGEGTTVRFEGKAKAISLFAKLMSPLTALMFGPMMRKCMEKDFNELKLAAESRGSA